MYNIEASTALFDDFYHKAVVTITKDDMRKRIVSDELFTSKKIALKHAQAWRNELRAKYN